MATAVLDSNVIIASRLSADQNHERDREIMSGVDTGDHPTGRIPDVVLHEALNYIHVKAGNDHAIETLDAIQASIDLNIDRTTKTDFDAGRSLFRRYDGASFTDAVIAAYMRRVGIEYLYNFDGDFDAMASLTRIDTTNPFG